MTHVLRPKAVQTYLLQVLGSQPGCLAGALVNRSGGVVASSIDTEACTELHVPKLISMHEQLEALVTTAHTHFQDAVSPETWSDSPTLRTLATQLDQYYVAAAAIDDAMFTLILVAHAEHTELGALLHLVCESESHHHQHHHRRHHRRRCSSTCTP